MQLSPYELLYISQGAGFPTAQGKDRANPANFGKNIVYVWANRSKKSDALKSVCPTVTLYASDGR